MGYQCRQTCSGRELVRGVSQQVLQKAGSPRNAAGSQCGQAPGVSSPRVSVGAPSNLSK